MKITRFKVIVTVQKECDYLLRDFEAFLDEKFLQAEVTGISENTYGEYEGGKRAYFLVMAEYKGDAGPITGLPEPKYPRKKTVGVKHESYKDENGVPIGGKFTFIREGDEDEEEGAKDQ